MEVLEDECRNEAQGLTEPVGTPGNKPGKLGHQIFVPQGFSPVRNALDDPQINLLIEPVDLGTNGSDGLVLAHGFVDMNLINK